MTPLETLTALRKTYPTPMSRDQLGALLNAVAWIHRDEGYGLLAKSSGTNCRQPQTGILISVDLLMRRAPGEAKWPIVDVLIDGTGTATPTWGANKAPLAPSKWITAVEVDRPPAPERPAPPPVSHAQDYPDEPVWWTELLNEMEGLYLRAGRPTMDLGGFKWVSRTAYDIGAGMRKEQARAKHLEELRAALGLS